MMSTCPNEELYCAYVDDEVPPILREKLEAHMLKCEKCKCLVGKYKVIRSVLVYDETPGLDLDKSFEKLILKRSSIKNNAFSFFSFSFKTRRKLLASAVASIFMFTLLFVLLRNNSAYDKVFTLHKGKVQFTPIVPMSYRQHGNIITNIDLHDMTSVVKTNKKYNKKIYKNITNTFNNFSCLYTSLESNTNSFAITMPNINEEIPYNYGTSIPNLCKFK